MQIHYEPHPVSQERKAELRAKGLRIIDERFAPEGYEPPKPKRKPRKKAVENPQKGPNNGTT